MSTNLAQRPAATPPTVPPRKVRATRKSTMGRAPQDSPAGLLNYLWLGLIFILGVFPLYWMFVIATGTDQDLARNVPKVTPGSNLTTNLQEVFCSEFRIPDKPCDTGEIYFFTGLINSAFVATLLTVSTLLFCSLAGFAFAKLRFKGSKLGMLIIILTVTVPNQLGVVALYIIMSKLPWFDGENWTNNLVSIIVPGLVSAFGVFYMRQFIVEAVPDELIEAARVDGASTLRMYWSVVMPAIRPALAVLGILTFVATWNDFQWPLIALGNSDTPTSMVALSDLASGTYVRYRRVLSGALMATLPLLFVLFLGGRQIVRGIMEGAVKA